MGAFPTALKRTTTAAKVILWSREAGVFRMDELKKEMSYAPLDVSRARYVSRAVMASGDSTDPTPVDILSFQVTFD